MAIQNVPAFPLRSQGLAQQAYSAGVEASLSALPKFIDDMNAVGSAYALTTNGTSTTSVAIGTGSKSFTTQTGLGYLVGMTLRLAFDSTNYMTGDVTSYNTGSGALVVNVTSVVGSGTRTSWVITMAAVGANNASSVSFTPAGNIAATNVQAAIQELDTEKLSSADGAVTSAKLADIITGATVGSASAIPVITYNAKGQVTSTSTAPKINILTPVAVTTGTSVALSTTIPSTAKRITVLVSGISTSGTSAMGIQIGTTSGLETSGYSSYAVTDGGSPTRIVPANILPFCGAMIAANTNAGVGTLIKGDGNTWHWTANLGSTNSGSGGGFGIGNKTLAGVLTRVTIIMANGTDTFDGGSGSVTLVVE
jgi:hypothetical protein